MPKENIYPRCSNASDAASPHGVVQWARDKFVSVGVQASGDYDEAVTPRPSLWFDLDREGINLMIRALRKARDQAFGSDA